MRNRRP